MVRQPAGEAPASDYSVLITANFSNRTGFAWTAFYRLFNHLAREFTEAGIGVVLSFARVKAPVEVLDPEIPHSVFEFAPLDITPSGLLRLRRNIRQHRIRYAYLTDLPSWHWLYALMRLWGVRVIVPHSHISVANPFPPPAETGIRRLLKKGLHRSRWTGPDHVLACSEFVKQRLIRKAACPPDKITVLYYGLPDHRFAKQPLERDPEGPVRIFCAGRATPHKGVQHLIDATALLEHPTDRPFEVRYAGDGPEMEALRSRAAELGIQESFHFLGYLPDTTPELEEADIVVIPSVWGDAFPYTVLEAMAAGKAVVASRAGGIPEQLGDPPAGVLVPPGDAEALADAMAALVADTERRAALGARALDRARTCFREAEYFRRVSVELRSLYALPL